MILDLIVPPSPAHLHANIITLHVGPRNHICSEVGRMFSVHFEEVDDYLVSSDAEGKYITD